MYEEPLFLLAAPHGHYVAPGKGLIASVVDAVLGFLDAWGRSTAGQEPLALTYGEQAGLELYNAQQHARFAAMGGAR